MTRGAGWLAMLGVAIFLATVVALHAMQRDYDPASQLMSELALGQGGALMFVAFCGVALALAAIQAAIARLDAKPFLRAVTLFAALSFLAAGLFPLGDTSTVHIAAIATAFVAAVLAMYLFPSSAGRAASLAPRSVSWLLAGGVAASVALGHSWIPMGIGQRLAAAFLLAWIFRLGWKLAWMK